MRCQTFRRLGGIPLGFLCVSRLTGFELQILFAKNELKKGRKEGPAPFLGLVSVTYGLTAVLAKILTTQQPNLAPRSWIKDIFTISKGQLVAQSAEITQL